MSSLVSCGTTTENATEEAFISTESAEVSEEIYKLGDTVETDIVKFTLNNAQLAIKLNSTSTASYDEMQAGISHITDDYFTADEYNEEEDLGAAYVAGIGHTYVVMEYYVENLNRTSVETDNGSFVTVEYKNESYSGSTEYGASSENGYDWEPYQSSNVLLLAGDSLYFRCYVDISTDADNLEDDFYLTFSLPNSDGSFLDCKYLVRVEDRTTIENEEISLDEAIYSFNTQEGYDYFVNHLRKYTVLTADEIRSAIIGKKWSVNLIVKAGHWSGEFNFKEDGSIEETLSDGSVGYFNNRTWKISEDSLILKADASESTYEVRKVSDNAYLLVEDSGPVGILQ
jgi:hypothetical protein